MKKTIQLGLLLMFTLIAFTSPLLAQDIQKESLAATKKYEDAYNKKDDKALKAMYTDDAVRTFSNGKVETGNEAIRLAFVEDFKADPLTITIKQDKVETAADGSAIATGTYHVWGEAGPGKKFDIKGSYTNTAVKVSGEWKISKAVFVIM